MNSKAIPTTDYDNLWANSASRFPLLQQFCSGIAVQHYHVIFPNTVTVENGLSVIGQEKNDNRKSLGNFSLDCILNASKRNNLVLEKLRLRVFKSS